jgi:sulfur-oxidizing protein SoxZ
MARALVNVPPKAKRGQVIEIKTLFSHIMETGFRHDEIGRPIPRDIVNKFVCFYNNVEVFRVDLFPAISANPFITFSTIATESGVIALQWTDDKGEVYSETARITVE